MIALSDVRRWSPDTLHRSAAALDRHVRALVETGDRLHRNGTADGWAGDAAAGALRELTGTLSSLDHTVAAANYVATGLAEAADAIAPVQREIAAAEALAQKYGFRITDDGGVVDDGTARGGRAADRATVAHRIADAVGQALRTATDIDQDLTRVLRRAQHGDVPAGPAGGTTKAAAAAGAATPALTPIRPPKKATTRQVADWWSSLSAAERKKIIATHPGWIGNLDGVPAWARSQANTRRLEDLRKEYEKKVEDLRARLRKDATELNIIGSENTNPNSGVDKTEAKLRADGYDALMALRNAVPKLKSLEAVQTVMGRGGRQLLLLDTHHKRVEAAVAVGDVDTARNVAVFTPGLNSTVNGSLARYDQNMQDLKDTADALDGKHGTVASNATVTWIGYQAPQSINPTSDDTADDADLAAGGAPALTKFYNGIGATHGASHTPLHLTALGHSYGSTTTGYALSHHTPVDDAVLFGSPGQGAQHLKVPTDHVYVEWNKDDYVPDLGVPPWQNPLGVLAPPNQALGPSPYQQFGATYPELSTQARMGELGPLTEVSGHSGYLVNHTASQYNIAAVMTGRPELAVSHTVPTPPTPSHPAPTAPPQGPGTPGTAPSAPTPSSPSGSGSTPSSSPPTTSTPSGGGSTPSPSPTP